jgi:hypothetical protein
MPLAFHLALIIPFIGPRILATASLNARTYFYIYSEDNIKILEIRKSGHS